MTAKADLNKLRKGLTKFLRPICDEGTWIETSSTHGNISCKYDGCSLNFTFPHRPSKTLHMGALYKQVQQKLASCGLRAPSKLKLKMVVPGDADYYLDQLFDFLEIQEKLFTAYSTTFSDGTGYSL